MKNAELQTSASQTHINKKDVTYAVNIIKNFEVLYVLFVPLIIISSFYAIDILMNFLGKYIIFINHPVIKIVLHVLISSFGISMFGTNITVELNSVWEQNKIKEDIALQYREAEVDNLEKETTTEEGDKNEDIL